MCRMILKLKLWKRDELLRWFRYIEKVTKEDEKESEPEIQREREF